MSALALLGGKPIRTQLFPAYNTIGEEEKRAVQKVLDTGNLSQFLGAWHEDFLGGPRVREFESAWQDFTRSKHAITVNSNTSGLFAAIGALGLGPGDEVVVSPYTMSASAIAPVVYGAVPVFADIDPDTFCISPATIKKVLSPRTKAILVVHIFGHPADMDGILALAKEHQLKVIEDCAQAPGSTYRGRHVGTLGDIGVFSLNYHKHIHTGEGGVITTQSDDLAERLQMIRNHGENIVDPKGYRGNPMNTWGFNFRMTEIEAAIGIEQLKKLPKLLAKRIQNAEAFTKKFRQYPGFTPPKVGEGCVHAYYSHPCKFDPIQVGFARSTFIAAMNAELPSAVLREKTPLIGAGYVKPLYLQSFYQKRSHPCAFNCSHYDGKVKYDRGICPTAEQMHFETLVCHEYQRPSMSASDLTDVMNAFDKVFEHAAELREWEKRAL